MLKQKLKFGLVRPSFHGQRFSKEEAEAIASEIVKEGINKDNSPWYDVEFPTCTMYIVIYCAGAIYNVRNGDWHETEPFICENI